MCSAWTPEEIHTLQTYYPEIGTKVVNLLPGRTAAAISKKVAKLGLRVNEPQTGKTPYRAWTPEELNILVTWYPTMGYAACALLPNRSANAVAQKALILGLTDSKTTWSEEDIKRLKELWPKGSRSEVGSLMGRTPDSVASKAKHLGLAGDNDLWTAAEVDILRTYYRSEGNDCLKRLPGRTLVAMQAKARRMHLSDGQAHRNAPRYVDGTFSIKVGDKVCTTRKEVADQLGITRIALCSFLNNREHTMEDAIAKYRNRVTGFHVGDKHYSTRKELYADAGCSRHTFEKYERLYGTEGALRYLKGER